MRAQVISETIAVNPAATPVRRAVMRIAQPARMNSDTHQLPRHLFTHRLDREWHRLRTDRRSVATVHSWAPAVDPEIAATFTRIDDLSEIVAATQRGAEPDGERLLLALVVLAERDQLAGRILVQRLLPGLVSAAARYRFRCDGIDPAEVAVGELWIAIRRYDHVHRRRHVAAALISDAIFAAFRRPARRRSAGEEIVEPMRFEQAIGTESRHPFTELATVVRAARLAGVPTADLDLIRQLVDTGSPGIVARRRQVTPRTVRNHRDRAVARIREVVAA